MCEIYTYISAQRLYYEFFYLFYTNINSAVIMAEPLQEFTRFML